MGKQQGSTQSTQQSQTDMGPWKEQQPYLTKLFGEASRLYDKGPMQYYPGSTVAGFTPAQTQGYGSIIDQGAALQPAVRAQTSALTDTLGGKYLDPNTNPYLAATYGQAADQVARTYQTATAPGTDAAFSMAGRYGSGARQQQVSNNQRDLGTTLNNLATSIYGGNYANERQNQMATMGNFGQMAGGTFVPATAVSGAGGAQQQQQQAELGDKVQRFNFEQMSPWQLLGLYQGATAGNYGQSGTTTTTMQQPYYSNTAAQGLGGLLSLGSMIGSLATPGVGGVSAFGNIFSDVRLKEDISDPIGTTADGVPLRVWRYKGDPEPRIGVIAQEVERVRPDAVSEHPSGFKTVNLDRALFGSLFPRRH